MTVGTLALPGGLSLVTIADRQPPLWAALFGQGASDHIPYSASTHAERDRLGVQLDAAVTRADRAVLLVAQGASCFATAWWARLSPSSYVSRVAGALFFQPVEDETINVDSLLDTFASPRMPLPFPSIVLGAEASRAELLPRIRALAEGWGSGILEERGGAGRANRTRRAIERFTLGVVKHDLRTAHNILGGRRALAPV